MDQLAGLGDGGGAGVQDDRLLDLALLEQLGAAAALFKELDVYTGLTGDGNKGIADALPGEQASKAPAA